MARFDIEGFKGALEAYDVDALLTHYVSGFEHVEVDAEAPPHAPRTSGADYLRGAVESAQKAGIKFRVDNEVVGENRAACSIYCDLPDGRTMMSNTILDLAGGKIARQVDVQVMDPES